MQSITITKLTIKTGLTAKEAADLFGRFHEAVVRYMPYEAIVDEMMSRLDRLATLEGVKLTKRQRAYARSIIMEKRLTLRDVFQKTTHPARRIWFWIQDRVQ